jgi:hypothetical protein
MADGGAERVERVERAKLEQVCLAFNSSERDACRLRQLVRLQPDRAVVAVADGEMTAPVPFLTREANFLTMRGFKAAVTERTEHIALDWFWLQHGYFEARYGTDWVSTKIPWAFRSLPNLISIVLPLEAWSKTKDGSTGVRQMLALHGADLRCGGVIAEYMSWEEAEREHWLVVATKMAEEAGEMEPGTFEREKRWVDHAAPFVRFVRAPSPLTERLRPEDSEHAPGIIERSPKRARK